MSHPYRAENELDIAMSDHQCAHRASDLKRYAIEHDIKTNFPNAFAIITKLADEFKRGGLSSCRELQEMATELMNDLSSHLSKEDVEQIEGAVNDTVTRYLNRNNRELRGDAVDRIMDTPLRPEQREELLKRVSATLEHSVYPAMNHETKQAVARAWSMASKTSYYDTPRELEMLVCFGYYHADGDTAYMYEDLRQDQLEPLTMVQRTVYRFVQETLRKENEEKRQTER